MIGRTAAAACLCLATILYQASRRASIMPSFNESADNQEVTLRVDEQFEIALSENPTTGYRWAMLEAAPGVCIITRDHFAQSARRPGSGGIHRWIFRAIKTGEGTIRMEKRRSFEKRDAAQRFRLAIRVISD